MDRICERLDLHDTRELTLPEDMETSESYQHYTCWKGRSAAARIAFTWQDNWCILCSRKESHYP